MGKFSAASLKCLIAGLNRARCPMPKIIILLKIVNYLSDNFPADFIAEGLDQTRGWFYTLTVLSTALFEQPAFKNVIVNGLVLAENGAKMSKRLKNYPDPVEVIHQYGADAIRLYMLHSPAVKGDDLSLFRRQGSNWFCGKSCSHSGMPIPFLSPMPAFMSGNLSLFLQKLDKSLISGSSPWSINWCMMWKREWMIMICRLLSNPLSGLSIS